MAKAKIRGFDCAAPAETMIRLVLRAQLNALCKHRDKALNWKDPEGVHDMRVLSRRLRSALNDFKPYFRKGGLPRPRLRAMAGQLGAVRDIDVALIALHKLKSASKGATAEGIKLLIAERKLQRRNARARLKAAVDPARIDEFRKQFLAKLRTITIVVPTETRAEQTAPTTVSFGAVGVRVINARLKDFTTASLCLYQPYDIKHLHELRILAKRLRYSMELFAACLGKEFAARAKEVAEMQTSLGELHDGDMWIKNLGARLRRIARKANAETDDERLRAAATWLLQHFAAERMKHYRDAVGRLQRWKENGFLEPVSLAESQHVSPPQTDAAQAQATQA